MKLSELSPNMRVRFTYLDDEPVTIDGVVNSQYGSVVTSTGVVLSIDEKSFGGPYVIVDDGSSIYLLDLVEVIAVI